MRDITMVDKMILDEDRHATLYITTRHPVSKAYSLITGASLVFQIKTERDRSGTAIVEKKNATAGGADDQIEDTNLTSGIYRVFLDPADTTGAGNYWCETKMTLAGKDATIFGPREITFSSVVID